MKADPEPSPATERDKPRKPARLPRWIVALATLVLAGVAIVILCGYWGLGWIGVADKTFWDYLRLLIVPAALALGVAWLNWEAFTERR
jgi:hypothetical protein